MIMPPDLRRRDILPLGEELLNVILPDVRHPRIQGFPDGGRGKRLGDRHERNPGGGASRALAGPGQPLPESVDIVRNHSKSRV
jgi:hypothetical protein